MLAHTSIAGQPVSFRNPPTSTSRSLPRAGFPSVPTIAGFSHRYWDQTQVCVLLALSHCTNPRSNSLLPAENIATKIHTDREKGQKMISKRPVCRSKQLPLYSHIHQSRCQTIIEEAKSPHTPESHGHYKHIGTQCWYVQFIK